jgi:hypothetical protein
MNSAPLRNFDYGIGSTEKLNLRVSVATLAKVMLNQPQNGQPVLVLERTAALHDVDGRQLAVVRAKPFGGGVRLNQPEALKALIGDFHFDSWRSRDEHDFRLFIRREDWERVKEFCLGHFNRQNGILETGPERELLEEFEDALAIKIRPDQYRLSPMGAIVEEVPAPTDNVRALASPTARIYNVFEILIVDPPLERIILENNWAYSDEDLQQLAWLDARNGGKGRANSVLAVPLDRLTERYLSIQPEERGKRIQFEGHQFDGNVAAVLEGVSTTKYQRRS